MSGYKLHLLAYSLFAAALTYFAVRTGSLKPEPLNVLQSLFAGAFYTLLPDVDMPTSIMRKFMERLALAGIVFSISAYMALKDTPLLYVPMAIALLLLALWFLRHRGFFHSTPAGLLLSAPLALYDPVVALFAFVGYCSHLAVDGKLF